MENPGTTLFQSSELFKLNTTSPEDEEAEAQEEEKRRNAQLRDMLSSAFDDLQVDNNDESFISISEHEHQQMASSQRSNSNTNGDSEDATDTKPKQISYLHKISNGVTNGISGESALSAHYQHCFHGKAKYQDRRESRQDPVGAGGDAEQIAEMYGVRMREIARLQQQGAEREAEWLRHREALERRVVQLEAELQAAQTTSKQTQDLLVSTKEQVAELLHELQLVKQSNKQLTEDEQDARRELLVSRTEVETLQAKVLVLERNNMQRAGEVQAESLLRSLQERHRKELANMQQQLDSMASKLENSESNLRASERRVWEMTRSHEAMLVERGDAVNRLGRALEESQQHCRELMKEQGDQPSVAALAREKEKLQQQVTKLEKELEQARIDVQNLETMAGLSALTGDLIHGAGKGQGLENPERLREELSRSLRNQEVRRAECQRLSQELKGREQELRELRQQESKYQQVVASLKEESEKLLEEVHAQKQNQANLEELSRLRQEVETLHKQNAALLSKVSQLEQQNSRLAEQAVELQRACDEDKIRAIDEHSNEYLAFHQRAVAIARQQEREQSEQVLQQLRSELELERQSSDEVKKAYVALSQSKAELASQLQDIKSKHKMIHCGVQVTLEDMEEKVQQQDSAAELEQRLRTQYEAKVKEEVRKAKQAVMAELARSEAPQQDTKGGPPTSKQLYLSQEKQELQAEVERLHHVLAQQAERMEKERSEAWSHFRSELQRVAEHQQETQTLAGNILHVERATSPVASPEPCNDQGLVEQLQKQLEQTKQQHASRLAELQVHLQDKHEEMEDFKNKMIEYTNMQVKSQEKFVSTLKQEIESLTTELNENKRISNTERSKLEDKLESWSAEMHRLKADKKKDTVKITSLHKKLVVLEENIPKLKDYYERREQYLQDKFKKNEEQYFEKLLRLKNALYALNQIEFSGLPSSSLEQPTKDV